VIFRYVLVCPDNIPSKMRTKTESVLTDVESMNYQSHEIIKPVSKLDSNLSIPYVDSRAQIPRIPAWKKEKINQVLN
jgi:hypothetical protein